MFGIHSWAFSDCDNLEDVTFKEGMNAIFDYAFENCPKLQNIVLPKSVTLLTCAFDSSVKMAKIPAHLKELERRNSAEFLPRFSKNTIINEY